MNAPLCVYIARNALGKTSHATAEFAGWQTKFFSCMTFDGSGDMGTGLYAFAIPKMARPSDGQITKKQRALVLLTLLHHMIGSGQLDAPFEFYVDKISHELNGGAVHLHLQAEYEKLTLNSIEYADFALEKLESLSATKQ